MVFSAVCMLGGCGAFERTGDEPLPPAAAASAASESRQQERLDAAADLTDAGQYDEAIAIFREILAENPTVTTAYLGLGDIHLTQGDYAAAEPVYARAARLEPRNFDAQFGHGVSLQMLDRLVDAVRAYHRALVLRPDSPRVNLNLATTYLQMEQARSALTYAQRAVELEPDNGSARINLGAVYDRLGMLDEAIASYRAASELVDPSPELIMNIVNVLARAGRYREAIDAAQTLNRLEPSANAYERMGWAWFRLGEFEQSAAAYREAVMLDPEHWPSFNGIGINALNRWLLSERRDGAARNEAREALRRSLRLNPGQERVISLLSTYQL